jgi:hypothetical protein
MPELSRFLGMVISIYFDDHNPPHFHVLENWNMVQKDGKFFKIEPLT